MKTIFILMFLLPFSLVAIESRGIRNNNPGNLRPNDWKAWPRAIGEDSEGYVIFKRPIDGLRAIVINLTLYNTKYKVKTIRDIINRWTDDLPVNQRKGYIMFLSHRLNVSPDAVLNLNDPYVLKLITQSIVFYENGSDPYPKKLYKTIFPYT